MENRVTLDLAILGVKQGFVLCSAEGRALVEEIERLTITCERWKNDRQAFEQIAADHAREVVRLRAAMTELHQIADSGESDIRAIGPVIDRFPELRQPFSAGDEHGKT